MYQQFKARGFFIWHVLIEGTTRNGQVPQSFCQQEVSQYGFTFPVLADPGARVINRFMSGGIPLNLVFTTHDMKIVYKRTGYSKSEISNTINKFLP